MGFFNDMAAFFKNLPDFFINLMTDNPLYFWLTVGGACAVFVILILLLVVLIKKGRKKRRNKKAAGQIIREENASEAAAIEGPQYHSSRGGADGSVFEMHGRDDGPDEAAIRQDIMPHHEILTLDEDGIEEHIEKIVAKAYEETEKDTADGSGVIAKEVSRLLDDIQSAAETVKKEIDSANAAAAAIEKPVETRVIHAVITPALPVRKKYVIQNRRSAVNMFSDYLNSKNETEKLELERSLNTVVKKIDHEF